KPTEAQVQQAVAAMDKPIDKTGDQQQMMMMLMQLSESIRSVAGAPLWSFRETSTPPAWGLAIHALAPQPREAQTQEVLGQLLKHFDLTTKPSQLRALVYSIQALPTKLTDTQGQRVLLPVLRQVNGADSNALPELAEVVQVLAGRLNEAQAQQAFG